MNLPHSDSPNGPRHSRWTLPLFLAVSFLWQLKPSEPFLTPFIVDVKHIPLNTLNNEIYPWWTYGFFFWAAVVPLLADRLSNSPLTSSTTMSSSVPSSTTVKAIQFQNNASSYRRCLEFIGSPNRYWAVLALGAAARVATRFILVCGHSVGWMIASQITFALVTAVDTAVLPTFLFRLLPDSPAEFQKFTSLLMAIGLAGHVIGALAGQGLVTTGHPLELLFDLSAGTVTAGTVFFLVIPWARLSRARAFNFWRSDRVAGPLSRFQRQRSEALLASSTSSSHDSSEPSSSASSSSAIILSKKIPQSSDPYSINTRDSMDRETVEHDAISILNAPRGCLQSIAACVVTFMRSTVALFRRLYFPSIRVMKIMHRESMKRQLATSEIKESSSPGERFSVVEMSLWWLIANAITSLAWNYIPSLLLHLDPKRDENGYILAGARFFAAVTSLIPIHLVKRFRLKQKVAFQQHEPRSTLPEPSVSSIGEDSCLNLNCDTISVEKCGIVDSNPLLVDDHDIGDNSSLNETVLAPSSTLPLSQCRRWSVAMLLLGGASLILSGVVGRYFAHSPHTDSPPSYSSSPPHLQLPTSSASSPLWALVVCGLGFIIHCGAIQCVLALLTAQLSLRLAAFDYVGANVDNSASNPGARERPASAGVGDPQRSQSSETGALSSQNHPDIDCYRNALLSVTEFPPSSRAASNPTSPQPIVMTDRSAVPYATLLSVNLVVSLAFQSLMQGILSSNSLNLPISTWFIVMGITLGTGGLFVSVIMFAVALCVRRSRSAGQ